MPRSMFDGTDLVNRLKCPKSLAQNIWRKWDNGAGIHCTGHKPSLAVFRNINVPALPRFGDGCRQLHEIFMQVDCRPIET